MEKETKSCRDGNKGLVNFCFDDFAHNGFHLGTHIGIVVCIQSSGCQTGGEDQPETNTNRQGY